MLASGNRHIRLPTCTPPRTALVLVHPADRDLQPVRDLLGGEVREHHGVSRSRCMAPARSRWKGRVAGPRQSAGLSG